MTKKFSEFSIPVSPEPGFVAGYNGVINYQIPIGVPNGIPYLDALGNMQPYLSIIPISGRLPSGCVFTTPPTLDGQLYSYTGNLILDLAKADVATSCQAFAGSYNLTDDLLNITQGQIFTFRFEPGLTLVGGDIAYISSTNAGLATNIQPSLPTTIIKQCGYVVDASMYNPLNITGSVAYCSLDPQPMTTN